jgi:two-component system nitrate/nitrite response regulator NarL
MSEATHGLDVPDPGLGRVKLLLVEDYRIFADLLADRMRQEANVGRVDVASSLSEARVNLRRSRPDLVLLDLNLAAGEVGLDLLDDLARMAHPPQVLMLSAIEGVEQIVRALEAGAEGWVSKTAAFETLMLAASEVLRGNMYLAPSALGPVVRHLLDRHRVGGSFVDMLSARQLEVLRCVIAGMSRAECAERLHLSVNTVRTHVQVLLKRADVHSTLALASLARDLGVRGIDDAAGDPSGLARRSPR